MPINTPGAVGRENTSGNSGSSVSTVVAGSGGVLHEHDGVLTVITGGTIGTDQIVLGLSLDEGRTVKRQRLGTDSSFVPLYVNLTISFAAGTLVAGDTIHTWHGSSPLSDSADWATARAALAAQQKQFRSTLLIGDLQDSTEANAYKTELEAYETANERFIYGRGAVYDREPLAAMSRLTVSMSGNPNVTFAEVGATDDTITRSAGSFITDGFVAGDIITIVDSVSNDLTTVLGIKTVTALVLTLDADDLADEGPVAGVTITGTPALTFLEVGATGDTLTRSRGSWLDDGFRVDDLVNITGTVLNNITGATGLDVVTALVLTFDADDLANEVIGSALAVVGAGQTKAQWMATIDSDFAPVDAAFRIDLAAGRGRVLSPFSFWLYRRSAMWLASLREYQHDLHIATWRKEDGPVDADLFDAEQNLVEWDDRVDGSAGSAARFTTMRTWANGPQGAFITLSLTREVEGSLLALTHNVAVTNLACTVVQLNTENVIGRSLVLNDDGTATTDSLNVIQSEVNSALELALLQNRGEGQRASKAVWTPSSDDILNVPEPLLTGVLELNLNGTIHSVNTQVRVISGGQ
jgi:hypothetical protein